MLTIVTVVKADPVGLQKTIRSAQLQVNSNWELCVVHPINDWSTLEVLKIHFSDDPRIKSIPEDESGIFAAMNTAIRHRESDFYWFMNAGDIFYDSQSLDHGLSWIEKLDADLIIGGYEVESGSRYPISRLRNVTPRKFSLNIRKGCHQAMIFRSSTRCKIGLYDLEFKLAADFKKILEFSSLGNTFWVPDLLTRITPNGVSDKQIYKVISEKQQIRRQIFGAISADAVLGLIWSSLLRLKLLIKRVPISDKSFT